MSHSNQLAESIQEIRGRIGEAAVRSHRKPEDVTLLAVTKTLPEQTLQAAYDLGLRDFGENRVQEALEKRAGLPGDIRWHLIGQLQTNKINKAIGKFVLIHSIDSAKLAEALSKRIEGTNQEVLLEVNTTGEASKSGISPEGAAAAAEKISECPGLKLRGLMTVGPLTDQLHRQREAFKILKGLFDSLRVKKNLEESLSILSMGMSGDFEAAIEEGSTLVRVGTAIFGPRG